MSEPDDILAAAAEVVERGYNEGLMEAVVRALKAERERCAKIAEGWEPSDGEIAQYSHGSHYISGLEDAADRIAAAIRRGTP